MTLNHILDEMESLGVEFSCTLRGPTWISPILPPAKQERLEELHTLAARYGSELFLDAIVIRLGTRGQS